MRRFRFVLNATTLALALAGVLALAPAVALADGLPTNNPCWSWQLPLPQGDDTPGLDFVDANEGWEVGASGLILHTTDSGLTWERQASGVEDDLWVVTFVNAEEGWVAGEGGILHTSDGGETWSPSPSDRSSTSA